MGQGPIQRKFGIAIAYTVGRAGLTPDKNRAENEIRPFVLGRKNWMFHGSGTGAEASFRVYSLIETAYLSDLLGRLPVVRQRGDWPSLLPWSLPRPVKN